jgi:uncharacterized protein YdeI (YjbR/CyaY-like superfamily)
MPGAPKPVAFASAAAFRAWLEAHHADTRELLMRLFKTSARHRGLGYRDALDEALCFGWIDGVRRALDAESFTQRFTPRRRGSRWSAVNVRRAKELIAEKRMRPPGLAAFEARTGDAAGYSFEARPVALAPGFLRRLRKDAAAWAEWTARPPWYRRTSAFWVMSAKRDETRERRFAALVAACRRAAAVPPLRMLEKAKKAGAGSRPRSAGSRSR